MSIAACSTCGGNVDPQTGICPQCATQVNLRSGGTPTETATVVTPGGHDPTEVPEIAGYRVINSLGEGGMGAVYLAEETTLGRRVAVKVISTRVAPDAQSKARFLREARTLATIEHSHVVRVYSFGEVDGRPYLAMEYVEGETLMERITRLGKLPVDDALRITRDIVDALDAAWDKRVIHRDIKPSNILMDRRNRVRVADFGLAKPTDVDDEKSALTLSGLMVGTPHYISPEQAQGKELDFRSDFYSLGIMLFHMLTGERPFQGSTPVAIVAKHIHEAMPLVTSKRADIQPAVERLIQWMTHKDVEKRPGSHQELLAAIDGLISRTPTAPMPAFSTIAIEAPRNVPGVRARVVAIAAAALLAIVVALAVWMFKKNEEPFQIARARPEFVVAVAPFYGPDDDSAKEGRVMAALIERAVAQRLGQENARVVGIEDTKVALRSHAEARELGTKLNASAVIWGEAFALRAETEIRPYVTLVAPPRPSEVAAGKDADVDPRLLMAEKMASVENLVDKGGVTVKLQAEAPNQIELRKTSASGIGDLVVLLAGIHALENEQSYGKAVALFRQAPRTAETLRYEVQALLKSNRREEARAALEQAIALDATRASDHALLGDLHIVDHRLPEALAAYGRAASLGQPYSTTGGILHEGRLYLRETYRHRLLYNGEETPTLFLVAIDPLSHRVLERHSLPGQITSLRVDGESLVIAFESGKDESSPGELRLRNGRFDKPLWSPPNLLWRMKSMKAGRVLPGNFLTEIDAARERGKPGGRFRLGKDPSPDLPATLPDLERALRIAAERDPTQPWHLFFLAVTLREQKRMAEADAALDELIRREYPGVPYFHFNWMLGNLERLRYTEWMDRLYPKALAERRKLSQPVMFSTLIERLINVPFVRQAASNLDIQRGYSVLLRAREIGGLTAEGEDLVAASWAAHFASRGDHARAEHERDVVRRMNAHPFNFLAVVAKLDYVLAGLFAALFGFIVLLLEVSVQALRRSRSVTVEARKPLTAWKTWLSKLAGPLRAAIIGLFLAGALLGVAKLVVEGAILPALLFVAVLAVLVFAIRRVRVSPRAFLASITRRERAALIAVYTLFVAAAAVMTDRVATFSVIAGTPIGIQDAFGHPSVIRDLEGRMTEGASHETRYVAAVANHYGGNKDRADELYRLVPEDYAQTRTNREALQAGRMPVAMPTPDELFAGLRGSRWSRWRQTLGNLHGPVIAFVVLLVFALVLFAVRPRAEIPETPPPSRRSKVVMLLVPGLYDVRHGHVWRALATIVLLMLPIVPGVMQISASGLGFGPATGMGIPNLAASFPLPTNAPDPLSDLRTVLRMAFPFARVFLAIIAAAGLAGLVLHALRIPAILREPREVTDADQPTRVNPASVST